MNISLCDFLWWSSSVLLQGGWVGWLVGWEFYKGCCSFKLFYFFDWEIWNIVVLIFSLLCLYEYSCQHNFSNKNDLIQKVIIKVLSKITGSSQEIIHSYSFLPNPQNMVIYSKALYQWYNHKVINQRRHWTTLSCPTRYTESLIEKKTSYIVHSYLEMNKGPS